MVEATHPVAERRALRAIALFEVIKGLAALAVVAGVVDLMHHDARHLAMELIGHFGVDPEGRYPSLLMHYADLVAGANVRALVAIGTGYAAVRLLEAYGLWYDRAWGEWLGALSGGLYIPFEVNHLVHAPAVIGAVVLAGNIAMVCFLAFELSKRRRRRVLV